MQTSSRVLLAPVWWPGLGLLVGGDARRDSSTYYQLTLINPAAPVSRRQVLYHHRHRQHWRDQKIQQHPLKNVSLSTTIPIISTRYYTQESKITLVQRSNMHAPPRHEHSQELTRSGRSSPAPGSNRRLLATHLHATITFTFSNAVNVPGLPMRCRRLQINNKYNTRPGVVTVSRCNDGLLGKM